MANKYARLEAKDFCRWRVLAQFFVIYFLVYPFFKIFYRTKVYGRENIPKDRPVIIAANHVSYFDPLIVGIAMGTHVAYMAKEELFHVPVLCNILNALAAFAVNREKLEISTIKTAKAALSTGWKLAMFPEGTRVKHGKIGDIRKGFAYLAKAANSEILPLAITGSDTFCGKLIVKIGKPFPVSENPEDTVDQWANAISELTGLEYVKQESEKV